VFRLSETPSTDFRVWLSIKRGRRIVGPEMCMSRYRIVRGLHFGRVQAEKWSEFGEREEGLMGFQGRPGAGALGPAMLAPVWAARRACILRVASDAGRKYNMPS
jgi:hypothetical protein